MNRAANQLNAMNAPLGRHVPARTHHPRQQQQQQQAARIGVTSSCMSLTVAFFDVVVGREIFSLLPCICLQQNVAAIVTPLVVRFPTVYTYATRT